MVPLETHSSLYICVYIVPGLALKDFWFKKYICVANRANKLDGFHLPTGSFRSTEFKQYVLS